MPGLRLGMLAALAFPASLAAQQEPAVYAGELRGDRSGCNELNGAIAEINVQGGDIKGFRADSRGAKLPFEGKLQGSTFTASQKDRRGNVIRIYGSIKVDQIDLRIERSNCVYRSVMKKK